MAKSEIIKKFAKKEIDTETALRILKVLFADFPERQIPDWVEHELSGYSSVDDVPEYRKTTGVLMGNVGNYGLHMTNVGIPLDNSTPESFLNYCNNVTLHDSIGAVMKMQEELKQDGNHRLVKEIPPDAFPIIMKHSLLQMSAVLKAQVEFTSSILPGIISSVDSKILDLLLELEKNFGNLDELDIDFDSKPAEEIKELNTRMIFNVFNNVHIGDGNKIVDSIIADQVNQG